ncbi:uncharacterized protein B0I36DRAFT_336211 [Microdochium trichocladiopsis]|uniref:Uncharacterized protein n=1 Tax=Microdochium trichocladiopsis TaxID=1682393 RepID=A0A9P8XWE9_9PEZI|nr:uncharacterized protein B0I36DRAFT_336211 [Microdochium trichocladiopsis]KAH7018561.1 hypothetical protein B0I36DRAFT_336211 [Microdochium trichocladiopsis]
MIRQARLFSRPSSWAQSASWRCHSSSQLTRASFSSRASSAAPQHIQISSTTSQQRAVRHRASTLLRQSPSARRAFHYNPQPYQPHPQPGKSWLKVLRDMALGSLLTIVLSTAYDYYEERQYMQKYKAEEEWAEDLRVQLAREFDEARSTPVDDSDAGAANRDFERQRKLRELTFALPPRVAGERAAEEAGWLPGFPYGDELHGKERVPAEETKMYITKDDYGGISSVLIAVNVDVDQQQDAPSADHAYYTPPTFAPAVDSGLDERRVRPSEWEDAGGTVLGELVARVRMQKDLWKRQGRLSQVEEDYLLVVLYLRNRTWMFLLDRGEVQPLSGIVNILK